MRKAGVLIVVLLAVCLLLIVVDRLAGLGVVKGALAWVLTPLQRGLYREGAQVGDFWEVWQEAGQLKEQNEQLRELVDILTTENRRYQEIKRENDELRQLLGLRERYPALDLLPAEVIGRDPSGLRQVLRIFSAAEERAAEIRVGMPVLSPGGFLVGKVIQVYPSSADVLLITDIGSSVSAVIQNEDRPTGIVDGRWQAGSRLVMRYIPQGDAVNEGDWVVTSGLHIPPFEEEAFPPGIPIGRVLQVQTSADLLQQVELIPAVDLDHLERVMIVLGTR